MTHFRPSERRVCKPQSTLSLLLFSLIPTFWGGGYAQAAENPKNTRTTQATQTGLASWYGGSFFQSRRTAQGQRFDHRALTAAHRTLPFGTKVLVQSPKTHRSVVVTINDRGPFKRHRIIDLSREAAKQLGMMEHGVVPVSLTVLHPSSSVKAQRS